jgi:hypothetical protein
MMIRCYTLLSNILILWKYLFNAIFFYDMYYHVLDWPICTSSFCWYWILVMCFATSYYYCFKMVKNCFRCANFMRDVSLYVLTIVSSGRGIFCIWAGMICLNRQLKHYTVQHIMLRYYCVSRLLCEIILFFALSLPFPPFAYYFFMDQLVLINEKVAFTQIMIYCFATTKVSNSINRRL